MSRVQFLIVLVVLYFGFSFGSNCDEDSDLRTIDSIQLEGPCVAAGGICTIAEDCPEGHLSKQRGLCPMQKDRGIECCYGISRKESRCRKRGGVCVSLKEKCNPQLIYNGPNDCSEDQKCCILI